MTIIRWPQPRDERYPDVLARVDEQIKALRAALALHDDEGGQRGK